MEEFVAVATAGGSALVGAMATDAWTNARERFARWSGHLGERRRELAVESLDQAAAEVAQVEAAAREEARQRLLPVWQVRLQDWLTEFPDAAVELRDLTAVVQAQQPAAAEQDRVQNNVAHGHGVVFGVQGGDQHIYCSSRAAPLGAWGRRR